jgi:hypothetical protein
MKDRNVKQVLLGRCSNGKGRGLERRRRVIWSMYFMHLHEDTTLKPVKIILSSGEGDEGE